MTRGVVARRGPGRLAALGFAALVAGSRAWAAADDVPLSQLGLERWTTDVGLAGSWVTDIAEGRDGFLWVTTVGGLSRFDGRSFRNFTAATESGLATSTMNAVAVDRDGRVWVGLEHGGVRFLERDALVSGPLVAGLPDVPVRSLAADPRGSLWIGTATGLFRSGPNGASPVSLPGVAGAVTVPKVVVAPDGAVWIRTRERGLFRAEEEKVAPVADAPGCTGNSIAFSRDGHPITSCVEGIWERKDETAGWARISDAPRVQRLLVDREGALWHEHPDGLARRLPDGRTEILPVRDGVGDTRIRALFEDSRGATWIGTFGAGLSRLRRGAVRAVGSRQGSPRWESTGIAADAAGELWVATNGSGLFRWSGSRGVTLHLTKANGLPSDRVWTVAPDRVRPGRVWVGTDGGLALLEGNRGRRVELPGGRTDEEVTIAFADPASSSVWASGPKGGVDEVRPETVVRHDESDGLSVGQVRAFHRDRTGALLAAGDGGIFRFDPGSGRWARLPLGGEEVKSVRALAEETGGTLWLASWGRGLLRWSDGGLRTIGEREGLPFSRIYSLELDGAGGLWLSGDEGLVRLKVDDVERWARGELPSVPSVRLSARDGMTDHECNGWGRPASTRFPDGTLAYPTLTGIAVVDPSRLPRPELSAAEVYLDRAATGARGIEPEGPFRLGAAERDLRLQFGCVEFDFPESVRFRYRLEGLDARWVPAGSLREAAYSRVPPGSYRFRLQARLPGQEWVEAKASPEVTVAPAPGESTWFRALAAALVLAVAGSAIAWRFRTQRVHASALAASREELRRLASALLRTQEEERARLARELHDDLTQRIAGLAMLTGVHAQSVRRGTGKNVADGLEEIGRELEKLAADSQSISRELHPSLLENVGLDGALRAECVTFGARTGLRVEYAGRDVPADLRPEVGIVLYRITQEALRNVVTHSGSSEARVTLEGNGAALTLTVEDSGRGFDPAARAAGNGLGLASMAERARLVKGRLTIDSRPGGGTRVRLLVRRDARSGVFAPLR